MNPWEGSVSAALITAAILAVLRTALVYAVVIVALKTNNPARRRTAVTVLRILRPWADLPKALNR